MKYLKKIIASIFNKIRGSKNKMLGYTNITSGGMTASSAANLTNKTGSNSQWTNDTSKFFQLF